MKFCTHPNAVQTAEEHPGGVSTYLREHRGRRHRVKRRYTEPMVLVERRCPDCPAYAAMTVQPGSRAAVRLADWVLPDDAPGGVEALEHPFPDALKAVGVEGRVVRIKGRSYLIPHDPASVGLWQLGAPDKPYDPAGLKDWSRNALCANCHHVGGLHRQDGCVGNTVTQGGTVECNCGWFRDPVA